MLGDLQQSMDSLEQGSKDMVAQVCHPSPMYRFRDLKDWHIIGQTPGNTADSEEMVWFLSVRKDMHTIHMIPARQKLYEYPCIAYIATNELIH